MHVIGLDIGTTNCKACVFDGSGGIAGYAFREYAVICTEPTMGEQDPELVWKLTGEVVAEAAAAAGTGDIAALSISVQGDAIMPLDRNGKVLHNAILGMDYRSEPVARELADRLGERALFDRTGMRPHPMNSLVKMVWLFRQHPEVRRQTARLVTYADFVTLRMCGEALIDYTMASRTMALDLRTRQWAPDILDAARIAPTLLSRPVASGVTASELDRHLAQSWGLSGPVLVVTGGHDQALAALGSGVIAPGKAVISTGTAEVLSTVIDSIAVNDTMYSSYYPCYLHAVEPRFFTFALNHTGGLLFRWYRDTLGEPEVVSARQKGTDPYTEIVAAMPDDLSPVMVLPHFGGSGTPTCDMQARGAIVGLSLSTTRHDIAKAVLEGLCFELRLNCETMARAGVAVEQLVAVGGGAKSPRWLQLKADILGRPIRTQKTREAACLGAALLAGKACGMYDSLEDGLVAATATDAVWDPDTKRTERYSRRFEQYCGLYPALRSAGRDA